ncbi:MAG: hypothetical protein R2793_00145 [Flavobacteriaceae bacterium]
MVFCLMAPIVAPMVTEDAYKIFVLGSSEEEHKTENPKEAEGKKLNENDLFVYDFQPLSLPFLDRNEHHFGYNESLQIITPDIFLPPPEQAM